MENENLATENIQNNPNMVNQDIVSELKQSYINYAMSVIVARALPDVRDGLKPVQRRILYAMHKMGITPGGAPKKVARISGETMGKYHPHGDIAINDALVRMAQDFSLRYPLISGQGNFGSIDGDPAAAARYIEARLSKAGAAILDNVEKTVDFIPNYDGSETEPVVLPSAVPNILINGGEGIAVGMATKLPPHNLTEVINGIVKVVEEGNKWDDKSLKSLNLNYESAIRSVADIAKLPLKRFYEFRTEIELKEVLKEIKGPDFPTGAQIFNAKEIETIYQTGRGGVLMRAVSEIEEVKGGRFRIIITELPFQVNKSTLLAKIAQLVKDKKIEGISDLRDESNKHGIRIVVELKREGKPKTVENQLYKYTELQKTFNVNSLALVNNEPKLLSLLEIIEYFVSHRQEIISRKLENELGESREREHILEGLLIALDHIDEIIKLIRAAKDAEDAKKELIKRFKLSEIQSQAILDMQLRKLAALERKKIEDEHKAIVARIKEIITTLSTPKKILDLVKNDLIDIKEKFGDKRKTKIIKGNIDEINEEDLVPNEPTFVTISTQGYIKRVKQDTYKVQNRGGTGVKSMATKEDDSVRHLFNCQTHDQILFFTNKGKVYSLKVYEIPDLQRTAKGTPIVNIINIAQGELITSVLTRSAGGNILDEDTKQEGEEKLENLGKHYEFLFMTTKLGVVKKTPITEFESIRSNGLIALTLQDDDELIWVKPTSGNDEVMLVTKLAKSIRFNESDVRDTGRSSQGVRGIKLRAGDEVISMDVVRNKENFLLTISKNGFGKMSQLKEFGVQNRGGTGIFAAKVNKKTKELKVARLLDHPNKELLIISSKGQAVKIPTTNLPVRGRQTSGVILMRLKDNDEVSAVAVI